jgi:hypothetical protein
VCQRVKHVDACAKTVTLSTTQLLLLLMLLLLLLRLLQLPSS